MSYHDINSLKLHDYDLHLNSVGHGKGIGVYYNAEIFYHNTFLLLIVRFRQINHAKYSKIQTTDELTDTCNNMNIYLCIFFR